VNTVNTVKFTINTSEPYVWSAHRASKLLAALGTIGDGLSMAISGADVIEEIRAQQAPGVVGSVEWSAFLEHLEKNGANDPANAGSPDPIQAALAMGFLQAGSRDGAVRLVSLQKGSIEGIIESLINDVIKAIGDLLPSLFQPDFVLNANKMIATRVTWPVEPDKISQARGLVALGATAAQELAKDANATIKVGGSAPRSPTGAAAPSASA
jgi:hypothetical protein